MRHPQFYLRFSPLLVVTGLILLSMALSFDGLYGQDAHEYLRLSRVYFDFLKGKISVLGHDAHSELAGGYPIAGALLRFLLPDSGLSLLVVSWLSAGLAVWMFERLLRLWAPGTSPKSRWTFTGLVLVASPYFIRAGITVMSDALGLFFLLGALYWGLEVLESGRARSAVWAAFFAGVAVITRLTAAAFLLPFAMAIGWHLLQRRQFGWAIAAVLAGVVALLPHFYFGVMENLTQNVFDHATLRDWSASSFFKRYFSNSNGAYQYFLPNGLYIFAPLAHPGFCLPVSLLFLMAKKTDFHHPSQRVLLACLAIFLFFIGGLPCQNMRYLLPAYIVLLLFLFPAWDRVFSYGFYFFKKLTWTIFSLVFLVQVVGTIKILVHPVSRNRLEKSLASGIRQVATSGDTVFTFDMDGAMRSYLPDFQIKNLWERRYEDFPVGSFILFNEGGLRAQWQGQNPMLNWDFANEKYQVREMWRQTNGWALYKIEGSK